MHAIVRYALGGALAAALSAGAALAEGERVTVATEASFPPFSKTEADGSYSGFEIDLGNAVCEKAGLTCVWVKQDFDGMIAALLANKFDLVFSSMSITPERAEVVDFSIPYYDTPSKFVAAKGADLDTSPEGLAGKAVGVYGGSTQDEFLQAEFADVDIRGYGNVDQISADLVAGRIDLMFVEATAAEAFLGSEEGQSYAFIGPDFHSPLLGKGAGAMFRQDQDALRAKIDAAIREVYADGTFERLAQPYFTVSVRADHLWED